MEIQLNNLSVRATESGSALHDKLKPLKPQVWLPLLLNQGKSAHLYVCLQKLSKTYKEGKIRGKETVLLSDPASSQVWFSKVPQLLKTQLSLKHLNNVDGFENYVLSHASSGVLFRKQ